MYLPQKLKFSVRIQPCNLGLHKFNLFFAFSQISLNITKGQFLLICIEIKGTVGLSDYVLYFFVDHGYARDEVLLVLLEMVHFLFFYIIPESMKNVIVLIGRLR